VARLHPVLDLIDLLGPSPRVRMLARTVQPVTVRSVDAIHLGTALAIGRKLTSFITYDRRLLEAATAAGLPAASPA
jgi:predicted nucleic acid-binding protein